MGAYFAFVRILSSVSRHHQTRGRRFPMEHFLESHRIVSSLPSVTELHISDLIELSTKDASVVPAPYCSSHQKDACRHRLGYDPQNMGRFSFVSVYVHSTPEEFHAINASPDELGAVVQTVNLVPKRSKSLGD